MRCAYSFSTTNRGVECDDKTNGDVVSSDIRLMIEKRFTELGITLAGADQELAVRMAMPPVEWPQRPTAP